MASSITYENDPKHQIPQVKGSVLQDCPPPPLPLQAQVTSPGYRLAVPMTLSLDFRHQLQARVFTCGSDHPAIYQRFPRPPP